MGLEWRDCIVTMIDLEGIKEHAQAGAGSSLMRRLHALVVQELRSGLPSVAHAYTWNDAVLLLSYVEMQRNSFEAALRDAEKLKRRIDQLRKSYAVAVKGRTFPPVNGSTAPVSVTRVTVVQASSWAMANCFEIPAKIGGLRGQWYVDGRIASRIRTAQACQKKRVPFLPSKERRTVHVYKGYLWD